MKTEGNEQRVFIVSTKVRAYEHTEICYSEDELLKIVSRETFGHIGDYEVTIKVKEL